MNYLYNLPKETLNQILLETDIKSIIKLGLTCKYMHDVCFDSMLWCELIVISKNYDDFTFYKEYNNDIISYSKRYLIEQRCFLDIDKSKNNNFSNYSAKTFYELWNIIKDCNNNVENMLIERWILIEGDLQLLISEIIRLFKHSLNRVKLYKQLSSSIIEFYKVIISGKNWHECCRYIECASNQDNMTTEYFPFCNNCRSSIELDKLLLKSINSKGPYITKLIEYDDNKNGLLVRIYDASKGIYIDMKNNFLMTQDGDDVFCIGRLINDEKCELTEYEKQMIISLGANVSTK